MAATSTIACCSWPRTRASRCSSGSSSARSTRPTSTSSSWSAWPACRSTSTAGSTARARTAAARPRRSRRSARRCASRRGARPTCSSACCGPALAEHGIRIQTCADVDASHREELDERFRRQIFPVLTPLAVGLGRPFPYISNLSLSLAVLVRDPQTAQETFARVKVPKEMLPRFLPVGDGQDVRPAREPDRRAPRHALPGHGDHRLRRLPRHARRRLHDRRRGRRPAARRRAGAAQAPLRRGRAGRGRRRHEPAPARAARARAGDRGGRAVRGRRPARPQGPVGHRTASPASPTCATRRGRR